MDSPLVADSPLTERDVRDIVRLLGDVIALQGGFIEKRRFLMDGLCHLVNATSWAWCMAEFDPDKPPSFIGFEHGGWSEERFARYIEAMNHSDMEEVTRPSSVELKKRGTQLTRTLRQMDPPMRLENSGAGPLWASADIGTLLISQRPMEGGGTSGVAVYRHLGEPDFNAREARIAHIVLSEVPWLHFQSFPDKPARELSRLYPRHRTVMNLLCEGWGRKRIADHLRLSVHTVHGYAKVIFRHFGVHSQAELIARFTKGDGGDA
ncbi:MAG TPA: helix-turn-helix transcriptional regulator [Luteolibacter sp.]